MRCFFFLFMKKIFLFTHYALLLVVGCQQRPDLVREEDYQPSLSQESNRMAELAALQKDIAFWDQRLQRDTGNFLDQWQLANQWTRLFQFTGETDHLQKADSLLNRVWKTLGKTEPELLIQLSQQAITGHRFREAAYFLDQAQQAGGADHLVNLVSFDTRMELGRFAEAKKALDQIPGKQSFDYALRRARWEDHLGNGPAALEWMEKAVAAAQQLDRPALIRWGMTNLSDMYLHNGQPQKAVEGYRAVLKEEPGNRHALRGLAWVAFSHDRQPQVAEQILFHLQQQQIMPELYLERAEIREWMGDTDSARTLRHLFVQAVDDPYRRPLYVKYLIETWSDDPATRSKAWELAVAEQKKRDNPETNAWLAWCQFKSGKTREAAQWMKERVEGQTFEPDLLFKMARVYAAAGWIPEARALLAQCRDAELEWGPLQQSDWEKLNQAL